MNEPIIVQVPIEFGMGYVVAYPDEPWAYRYGSKQPYKVPVTYYEYNGYGPFDTYDDAVQWLREHGGLE